MRSSTRRWCAISAFVHDGRPAVIPTLHARVGDEVLVHGSAASRALRALATGIEVCLTVTLIDGLVMARSAFHHSVNYRSVVLYGTARPLDRAGGARGGARGVHREARPRPLGRRALADPQGAQGHVRAARCRSSEGSAKVRTGPPIDDDEDYALDAWAGVVPMRTETLPPVPDPLLRDGIDAPGYLRRARKLTAPW